MFWEKSNSVSSETQKKKWLWGRTELFSTLKTIYPLPTNPNSFMFLEWLNLGFEVYEILHG
jgi:hypothetical protein